MGLFKKCYGCKSFGRRVRQKPVQMDLFGLLEFNRQREFLSGEMGIPRKRALSPTSKFSSFWRSQKYAKPSLHAARSPGIWDSARR